MQKSKKTTKPSALFILAGDEPIGKGSLDYEKVLSENSVNTDVKIFENVLHGFIEENNPEYEKLHDKNKTSKSPEAEKVAREAEDYIMNWISKTKQNIPLRQRSKSTDLFRLKYNKLILSCSQYFDMPNKIE